ncbi:hypothetical protein GMORB2_7616 [Geosmithia morbida]|uniref:Only prolin and serin are matching in the corresponding protein n=1 Tax=Geosmithia morbida TaxID=1094350 RepID=A0A9P4YUP2_9HYPO|nr:uncharacterized protein GMORB2_7616 [Geosmithia morbida]KAF4122023.1 hypothetical protein GMORB2_7616 [Geosmithia morbida]
MAPQLRPLLLPQLVEEQQQQQQQRIVDHQQQYHYYDDATTAAALPYVSYTNNSSSSDIVSPVTPTFSARGHFRGSSSSSSLDISFTQLSPPHDSPTPPQKQQPQLQQPQQQATQQQQQQQQQQSVPPTLPPLPSSQPLSKRSSKCQLPDVAEEEPYERDDEEDATLVLEHDALGLYSCLCDEPCDHRKSTEKTLINDLMLAATATPDVPDFDYYNDAACLGSDDVDFPVASRQSSASKRPELADLTSTSLTSRLGPRLNASIDRWRSSRRGRSGANHAAAITSPSATDVSVAPSGVPSSRSSSISSPNRGHFGAANTVYGYPSASAYDSVDSFDSFADTDYDLDDAQRAALERDREKASTPLLPPLMTESSVPEPPLQSPLQSPTVAPPCSVTDVFEYQLPAAPHQPHQQQPQQQPPASNFGRPPLNTKPSTSSLRRGFSNTGANPTDLPIGMSDMDMLQEYDEWSDRLGHANFTINPPPYEPVSLDTETMTRFREDWDAARVNYTKHLVRTGENYGETSKIYGLTEAKWAETDGKWRRIHEQAVKQAAGLIPATSTMAAGGGTGTADSTTSPAPAGSRSRGFSTSRAQSRGRGRGRSDSASAILWSMRPSAMSAAATAANSDDAVAAGAEWQRIEDNLPSAVPRMLSAEGKFPSRGDEDIVGPMHRAQVMERSHSEEKYGSKFWRNLAEKVLRR